MSRRVTFLTAAVSLILLLAGCGGTLGPAPEQAQIRFEAGSLLLLDDAQEQTKTDPKDSFRSGDTFAVFGTRTISGVTTTVFGGTNGVTVRAGSGSPPSWTYGPIKSWYWESSSDYYDFVAASPADKGTVRMDIPGNIAISTSFDITADNYDLLGAANRRRGNIQNPMDTVNFRFAHMTSVVQVKVMNNSENIGVTIDSYHFKNLVVVGDAKVTLDLSGYANRSWINTERNSSNVRVSEPDEEVDSGETYLGEYNFMIPQRLDQAVGAGGLEANMPKLYLYYTPESSVQKEAIISLKDICPRDSSTPITSWQMGSKYIYEISMRLDGGVLVTVTTTDWGDPVEAETPGLLI